MAEQELREEFKEWFYAGNYGGLDHDTVAIADWFLSKFQDRLSSLRGEIEGEKMLDIEGKPLDGWGENACYNDGLDKALSCIDKLIGTK